MGDFGKKGQSLSSMNRPLNERDARCDTTAGHTIRRKAMPLRSVAQT